MGCKREPDEREKEKNEARKAALRRRREILDALLKVLRGG
jgi:hypothetical protein